MSTPLPAEATTRRGYSPLHRRRRTAPRLPRPLAAALPLAAVGAATLLPASPAAGPGADRSRLAAPRHAALPTATLPTRLADAVAPAPTQPGAVAGYGASAILGAPGPGTVAPVVAMARTPSDAGYWVAAADGGVFSYGDAAYHGSLGGLRLDKPIVGIAATPDGGGYWLVAADGGVFSYGDAAYHGSLGGLRLDKPIVGIAATPDGRGYWLVAADGGVFSFGDAGWYGSAVDTPPATPVVGMAATPSGQGYWLATAGGDVLTYGDAATHGDLGATTPSRPITSIAATPDGGGYWLAGADGGVFSFGDATYRGSLAPEPATTGVVAIVAGSDDASYRLATAPAVPPAPAAMAVSTDAVGTPLGTFEVTCYDLVGPTASGAMTSLQTVAVDPRVIPLGTTIDIAGVGTRVAQDTGSAVIGDHVDIWEPSLAQCDAWGVQSREVWRVS